MSNIKEYLEHFYKGRSSTPKRLKEIQREHSKITFLYPLKNNLDYILFVGILYVCMFLIYFFGILHHMFALFSDFFDFFEVSLGTFSLYIFSFLSILPSIFVWYILYRIRLDWLFCESYYTTWEVVVRHLSSKNEGKKLDLNLELFQLNYNMLRKRLKKRIRLFRPNFLTYDYEISRITRDIDTFFDATIKILFRRKVMAIPFSPHDEYDIFMEEAEIQSQFEYELEAREVKGIDYRTIDVFLQYFGDIIIRKPRKKAMNTVAIGELFRRWNSIVEKLNNDIFEESKNDVEKFYDEKQERRSILLKTLLDSSILLILGLITGGIINFVFRVILN